MRRRRDSAGIHCIPGGEGLESMLRGLALGLLIGVGFPNAAMAAPAAPPVIGCASLVNLRILLRQTKADMAAAAALLGNDQADHLGCMVLARDVVTARQEHLSLNGSAYDCLSLRNTSVCHWVVAGTVTPGQSSGKARSGEKPAQAPEKGRR